MKSRLRLVGAVGLIVACNRYELRPMDARDCPPTPPPHDTLVLSHAPHEAGSIRGVVMDEVSGHPIAGAQVVILPVGRGVTSDASGEFNLDSLPVGNYDLVVRSIGYERRSVADVQVSDTAGVRARLPLRAAVMDACPGFAVVRARKPWWR